MMKAANSGFEDDGFLEDEIPSIEDNSIADQSLSEQSFEEMSVVKGELPVQVKDHAITEEEIQKLFLDKKYPQAILEVQKLIEQRQAALQEA
jgi:hypothetical protein